MLIIIARCVSSISSPLTTKAALDIMAGIFVTQPPLQHLVHIFLHTNHILSKVDYLRHKLRHLDKGCATTTTSHDISRRRACTQLHHKEVYELGGEEEEEGKVTMLGDKEEERLGRQGH